MKILKERYEKTWETMLPRNKELKAFISKDHAVLVDLYHQILAYDLGIKFQTRADYPKKVLGSVSVISNVSKNTDVYSQDDIQKAKDKVEGLYTGSLSPERAKYIKELNLTGDFMGIVPSLVDFVKPTKPRSLNEDFKSWLSYYDKKRNSLAKQIKSRLHLKNGFIKDLQQIAFDEILALVSSGTKLTDGQKSIVALLENGISEIFPMFLKDLDLETNLNLQILRKRCGSGFNTVCQYCGKPLLRNNLKNYCLIRENRPCYLARSKPVLIKKRPDINTNASAGCDNCGIWLPSPLIYKVKGVSRSFCSNRCRHTFRQKILRNSKKYSNLNPSLH